MLAAARSASEAALGNQTSGPPAGGAVPLDVAVNITVLTFPTGMRRALLGGLVYLVAIVVALFSPGLSFAIDALVAVYFALSRSQVPGLIHRAAPSEGTDTFS